MNFFIQSVKSYEESNVGGSCHNHTLRPGPVISIFKSWTLIFLATFKSTHSSAVKTELCGRNTLPERIEQVKV